jgi:hypothetical protein
MYFVDWILIIVPQGIELPRLPTPTFLWFIWRLCQFSRRSAVISQLYRELGYDMTIMPLYLEVTHADDIFLRSFVSSSEFNVVERLFE